MSEVTVTLPGEQVAPWSLSCALERVLAEPFADDYDDPIADARSRLYGEGGA